MKINAICKIIVLSTILTSTGFAMGTSVNVEFEKGKNSGHYSGVIKGYDYDVYNFLARKGQKIRVNISNQGAYAYLLGPGIEDSVFLYKYSPDVDNQGRYILPASGKYELRIMQTRNDARKYKKKEYSVDIEIK